MSGLAGKTALVTGASNGIGAAAAAALAADGAAVALVARTADRLAAGAAAIVAAGGRALAVTADVGDPVQVAAAFARVAADLGPVDVLICAAGDVVNTPFVDLALADWERVIGTNLHGTMLCCQAAFRQMAPRGGGTILLLSSLSGVRGVEKFPGLSAYVASKFGVAGLGEALAVEGKPLGIRVVTVSPGAVDTPMLRAAAPHLRPGLTPAELARVLVFFAGDAAPNVTSVNLELFSNA